MFLVAGVRNCDKIVNNKIGKIFLKELIRGQNTRGT